MSLADLIQRKKTTTVLSPATAIPAIPAIVAPFTAEIPPRIATIATIAVAVEFDPSYWQAEIMKLADELSSKDPGGDCWQWQKDNRPDLWNAHLAADMAADRVFQEQDAGKIGAAISETRGTFTAMIDAWNNRHDYKQPSLMAA